MADAAQSPVVSALWAEDRGGPEFLPTATPRLSWQIQASQAGWLQARAELHIRHADGALRVVAIDGRDSQHVLWPAEALAPYSRATLQVRVCGLDGEWSPLSESLVLRTGPVTPADWQADFIALPGEPSADAGTVRFRTDLEVREGLAQATLSVTAHGVYEAVVNGAIVGDEVLAPGWTAYDQRLLFQTHDVTALLHEGANVLGATVAEGWYRERFGFDGAFRIAYSGPLALAAQLRLEYADGTTDTVVTGPDWTASGTGPTVATSIYQGETYDARLDDDALADAAGALPGSMPAAVCTVDASKLRPASLPPVRRIERLAVQDVLTSASGKRIVDFGQNLVGWLELQIDLPEGTELTLRHAEVLEHGELSVRPLRFAAATDRYIAAAGPRVWSPRFTFHGFRYAQIDGLPDDVPATAITAIVVHSDMRRTGWLETSDPMLNQLHENVVWGMRGNFVSIPTDCPQRDERLGWTGDITVFAPAASYLYDVTGFLGSWLDDLALEQGPNGHIPLVVPSPLPDAPPATAVWGDAATLVPATLHERSGDRAALERQYPSMRAWVEAERALAGDDLLWTGMFQFGDWLDPTAPPENPAGAKADADLVATAYFFRSTQRLAEAAAVLGRDDDAADYTALAEGIRTAFLREYVTPAGRMLSDAHTAYALAIVFGLVRGEQAQHAGDRLAALARAYGYRVRTGFVGTPLLCDALTMTGHLDTAYRLLLERGNPSWLYPITMGATTIWERWDSMLPDGSINPGEMTSFNHYALGAVADWMHRTIGGIAPGAAGYRDAVVQPQPGGGVTRANARLDTGYGVVETRWHLDASGFHLALRVPANSGAHVTLPGSDAVIRVGSGSHEWTVPWVGEASVPAPLTMHSTLAEFADDPAARAALEGLFAELGYFIGLGWTGSGRWLADSRLDSSLMVFPREHLGRIEALLATLNERPPASTGHPENTA